jgi:hypothetical protein
MQKHTERRREEIRFQPIHSLHAILLDEEELLAHGMLVNISESGARIITNVELELGRRVQMYLRSYGENLLAMRAQVVWSSVGLERSNEILGVRNGLRFAATSEQGQMQIRHLLNPHGHSVTKRKIRFDALVDLDVENLFDEKTPTRMDYFEDLQDALQPDIERLVRGLTGDWSVTKQPGRKLEWSTALRGY